MKPDKIILIILIGLALNFSFGCGYTVLKKSSKSSEYTNTQQNYSYKLSGRWTQRKGGISNHNGVVNAWVQDYYLIFFNNGTYGFSMRDRAPNHSGNYYVESDTLTLVTEYNISKYKFSREGEFLILKFINWEIINKNYRPVKLTGAWSPNY